MTLRRTTVVLGLALAFLSGVALGLLAVSDGPAPAAAVAAPATTEGPALRAELPDLRRAAGNRPALEALPYLETGSERAGGPGATILDPARVSPGFGLYCLPEVGAAILIDLQGREVHRWPFTGKGPTHCELTSEGELLAIIEDEALVKVDLAGRQLWRLPATFHHDFWRTPRGEIVALARRRRPVTEISDRYPVVDDLLLVISAEGRLQREISLFDTVWRSPYRFLLPATDDFVPKAKNPNPVLDLLHTNHVEVFDGRLAARSPLYAAGNLLVSMRVPSLLLILDPTGSEVLWAWGPSNLLYQHHPSLLADGKLLVFNNGTRASEVLEVDPLTHRVGWRYANGSRFFSESRGSCQRLPNGNTLITESNAGYVFEITRAGEMVWEWTSPHRWPDGRRMSLWRMDRYPPERVPFLALKGAQRSSSS